MDRRQFLTAALIALAAFKSRAQSSPMRTRWRVRSSEAFDAIAFLGPISGRPIYRDYYVDDVEAFAPRIPDSIRSDVPRLWEEAEKSGFGLFWPMVASVMSGSRADTLDQLIDALVAPEKHVRPAFQASAHWDANDWAWFAGEAARIRAIFMAMREAGFATFRKDRATDLDGQVRDTARALVGYDVVRWQEKLTGRSFDPTIDIVLLRWSKPHGVKVQGQAFLQSGDYNTATTVRIAAHEMLHPPIPMDGPAAKAALAIFEQDPLMMRIVSEHDPKWGYTTLKALLDEDMAEALDQLISEALGVGRNPADRWRTADDGMHVIAAGLYGLLRDDKWIETGGSIEAWLEKAASTGRLAPAKFHAIAGRVLERAVNGLWPLGGR